MADTAYERFLKDPDKEEAVEVDIKKSQPLDLDQIKLKIQSELSSQTKPKKPVKWLKMPDPKNILELYYTLEPTKRLANKIVGLEDPKQQAQELEDAKAPSFKINNKEITQERDYTTGLDEIAKGISSGIYDLQNSLGSLLFAGTDLAANTDFLSRFENMMEKQEPTRPETWRGELTSLLTQFGIPGTGIAKIVNRIPAVVKMKKAADAVKGGKLRKVSQVASRATEGATIVGVTDFLASDPGRESFFVEPEDTKGLTGREKAGAELRNRIKYGAEGTLVGGGFPLVGKFTQLGYKYGLSPLLSNRFGVGAAQLGAKGVNATVIKPVQLLLGNKAVAPLTREVADGLQKASNFTVSKLVAPMLVSGMSGKIVRQLPPFEKWRLQSVTSPNRVNRNIKRIDNFLSWFRSYGKQPKDIEGVSEQVSLYIKGRARKIDRTYEGLEKTSYNLAKKFENDYNKATTSQPMQKYFLDQVDEFLKGQRSLNDLPQELQALSKDLAKDIKSIVSEFKKVLPKGKEADALAKDLATVEINNIGKYLVRSFQTFRNPEYVPDEKVLNKAVDYLVNNVIKKNINLRESAVNSFPKLKPEQAYIESAKMHAEDILRTGKAEGKAPLKQLKDIGTRILQNDKFKFLKTGEELPDAIKNLLGPERNLKASVAYTTSEAISSMANKKAADYIAQSGLKNGWIFNSLEDARNAGFIGAQQIKSVPRLGIMKSQLLNKWASPEYVEGFKGAGGTLDKLVQMSFYRHALQAKVGVQIGKTLYSPQTQVRNVTSASFFALMNGHVGSKASVTDAMRIVARDIFKAGGNKIDEVEFNDYVEKLVRLGVWDENVVASEMKSVLSQIKDGSINTTDALFDKLMKMAPTDKVARLYAGGDNLWKGYGFEYGKSQLSMALKNLDEVKEWFRYMGKEFQPVNQITGVKKTYNDAIEEASAYLLRNTYPTYSKVPPVIQELRKLPLGNFISFPAEILRTGANIISTGLKEAAHPTNRAIQQMGIRRLTGAFMTSYAVGKGFTELSQFLTNSTDSQWNAYKRSSAASWDATSNLLAVKGWKNGESAAINFSYFSPYDSLYQPLDAALAQAQQQNLNPQETEQFVMNLMFGEEGPVMKFLEPFISEPLGFDRFIDVTTRNGKKDGGGSIYTQSDDLGDKFIKSLTYVLDGVKPGIITSGQKIGDALSKDLTKGGKPVNLSDELLALFTGTRIIRIDVKKDLRYFTSTMNRLLRAVDETEGFYSVQDFAQKTPTDMVNTFNEMQKEAYRIQKDMYIRIKDLELLDLKKSKIFEIMKSSGASRKLINNLLAGRFTPVNYSKPRFESKVRTVKDQMRTLSKDNEEFRYRANRSFLFPQRELDKVIGKYNGIKFFPKTFNEETGQREGGYNPDNETYQVDKEGRLIYDENGQPLKEEGFIQQKIKQIPNMLKDLTLPGAPGFTSKPETPPLPNTPSPTIKTAQNVNPQTGLTQTETALLSPGEQVIKQRLRT
tara:strand:- start:3 stop:4442 length:4440 start_codon:yes stop_codon:yes gene_type:complete